MAYRIHEFAQQAGVTVKALRHYDRLGLLRPQRSESGYRIYTDSDLERLEQIVALKFIGVPLRQIRALLQGGAPPVAAALQAQRAALEEKQRQLAHAVAAIDTAERSLAESTDAAPVLRRLIGAITMEEQAEILRPYFGEAAWTDWKTRRAAVAAEEWTALYRDIEAVRGEPLTSPRAQAVAERWRALVEAEADGDPSIRGGILKAWLDGHRLPVVLNRSAAPNAVASATKFVSDVLWAKMDAELRANPQAVRHKTTDARIALFRDTEALVDGGSDPGSPEVEALLRRWDEALDQETEGDPDAKQAMQAAWEQRARWPDGLRHYVASLYDATPERWTRVHDFIERAREARARSTRTD